MKPPEKKDTNSRRQVYNEFCQDSGYNQAIDDMNKWMESTTMYKEGYYQCANDRNDLIEEADICSHCYKVLKGEE